MFFFVFQDIRNGSIVSQHFGVKRGHGIYYESPSNEFLNGGCKSGQKRLVNK